MAEGTGFELSVPVLSVRFVDAKRSEKLATTDASLRFVLLGEPGKPRTRDVPPMIRFTRLGIIDESRSA
jgi:hypothetical protein